MSGENWKELASLEALMFRQIEIKNERAKLLEESQTNNAKIEKILRENEMNFHSAVLNDNFEVRAEIKHDRKKVFEKEKMAGDLDITPGATQKKDVLINLTEKQQLTLDRFKTYFSYEPYTNLSVRRVKIRKPKNKKR